MSDSLEYMAFDVFTVTVPRGTFEKLYDEYLNETGRGKEIKKQIKRWKKIFKDIHKYTVDTRLENRMYYEIAQSELEVIKKESQQENIDIYPYIIEKYGFIDKKKISVRSYHNLYKNLSDG